jgi:hypothetical protein
MSGEFPADGTQRRVRTAGWLPFLNTYRTMLAMPSLDFKGILEGIRTGQSSPLVSLILVRVGALRNGEVVGIGRAGAQLWVVGRQP